MDSIQREEGDPWEAIELLQQEKILVLQAGILVPEDSAAHEGIERALQALDAEWLVHYRSAMLDRSYPGKHVPAS